MEDWRHMGSYLNKAGDTWTKAGECGFRHLIWSILSSLTLKSYLLKKKKKSQGTKVRSELRLSEISTVSDKQAIKGISDREIRWASRTAGVGCIPDIWYLERKGPRANSHRDTSVPHTPLAPTPPSPLVYATGKVQTPATPNHLLLHACP